MWKFSKQVIAVSLLFIGSFGIAITTTFVNSTDEEITLRNLLLTSGKDNVQAIYSKPLSDYLHQLLEQDRFFESIILDTTPIESDIDALRANPRNTADSMIKKSVDGMLHLQVSKGPMGVRIELGLFTKKSGRLWAYADIIEKEKFDLEQIRYHVKNIYEQIMLQIPYQGLVLSRTGSKVTFSRGLSSTLNIDDDIQIIQILAAERHPQFQFVTHVQKEIIGKIRITKVDETIGFGYILFEKEPQSIQPGLKLSLRKPIPYPNLITSENEPVVEKLLSRSDGNVIIQGDAKEWLPQKPPTFGRVNVSFGLGQFGATTNLTASGGQQASTLLALNARVDADLWITRSWYLRTALNQGSAQLTNPLANSTPTKLIFSLQSMKIAAGYDFEISPSLYGPRLQGLVGFSQFTAHPSESSPTSFTSSSFSGMGFGLSGYVPWDESESKWGFGAELWLHLYPQVTETPVSSGSSEHAQIIELSGLLSYHWQPNIYWIGKLALDSFNTHFSGTGTRAEPATSSDFSWTRVNAGIEFLF